MSKNLIIVESPAKANTIAQYLGDDFEVIASIGHIRDLPSNKTAVDPEKNFAMTYEVSKEKEKQVKAIVRAAKKADNLYLATDPDREGEAISWHLTEILRERNALNDKPVHRVVFYEVTKDAVKDAITNPKEISWDLVNAYQVRRALDHLFGFNLSELLWTKVVGGKSAGRVQSPALRLIVERESEIEAFNPREHWSIEADISKGKQPFLSRLVLYKGEKVQQFSFENESAAKIVETTIFGSTLSSPPDAVAEPEIGSFAYGKLIAINIEKKQRRSKPAAPFTTSTLQQEASRKLGFYAQRTMRVAQSLYQGIELPGEGTVGLITYMRTDSVSLADVAVEEIRNVIGERFGAKNVPAIPPEYKTKSKNAQEAHEAIRPTSAARTPDSLKGKLDEPQLKLYTLIWQRTMASQMVPAIFDTVMLELSPGNSHTDAITEHRFRANGSVLIEPGYKAVYQEGVDDSKDDDTDRLLPEISVGDVISLDRLRLEQHFTDPAPRFTEATLVKALEEYGIGRPSTYANIIEKLKERQYVEMDSRRFFPTNSGRIVTGFLSKHFSQYIDYDFTARMEDDLDAVSLGEQEFLPLLEDFWGPFKALISQGEGLPRYPEPKLLGTDPESGKPITVRWGKNGFFVMIGTREDEEKPKFAALQPGQNWLTIELEEALDLFSLPRLLGTTPEGVDHVAPGLEVHACIGPFGPYVKYGHAKSFKNVSIKGHDPYTIELELAVQLIQEKQERDKNRIILNFEEEGIQVLNGRYGPYITNKTKNAKVPKDREPKSLTLEECRDLLKAAPTRKKRGKKRGKKNPAPNKIVEASGS